MVPATSWYSGTALASGDGGQQNDSHLRASEFSLFASCYNPCERRGLGVESVDKVYRSACIAPLPLLTRAHVGEEELRAAY